MPEYKYRELSAEEIMQLIAQGCSCRDWKSIQVIDNFLPDQLMNVHFSGYNRIGRFDQEVILLDGIQMKSGIFNVKLHNCIVENNALIKNIRSTISNCRIGERVVMHHVNDVPQRSKKTVFEPTIWLLSAQPLKAAVNGIDQDNI